MVLFVAMPNATVSTAKAGRPGFFM